MTEILSDEQLHLFNQITDLQGQMGAMDAEELYVQGFRDGVGILLDSIADWRKTE